jgi:IclR family transcriptional regulator, acetate operon repressor
MNGTGVPISETRGPTYLGRLLDTIELISGGTTAVSYRDAARALGVPPSTAHRLLTLLLNRGYCDRSDDGPFRPGPRLISIGVQALETLPHWAAASRVVSELSELTSESASFGLLIRDQIVLIARHNSPHVLTAIATVGDILSPHTSALGKVILANSTPDKQTRILGRFVPGGAGELRRSLEAELMETARCGYSVDEETFSPGIRCRAVPVIDPGSALLGGLSVSGPSARFTPAKAQAAIPLLQDAAKRLVGPPFGVASTDQIVTH